MADVTNRDLCMSFFELMTKGFFATPLTDEEKADPEFESKMLQRTREWRRQLWKEFYRVEERLCPRPSNQPPPDYAGIIARAGPPKRGPGSYSG